MSKTHRSHIDPNDPHAYDQQPVTLSRRDADRRFATLSRLCGQRLPSGARCDRPATHNGPCAGLSAHELRTRQEAGR